MDNRDILKRAIDQARSGGFELSNKKHAIAIENDILGRATGNILGYESIIFDHDFAKAFWGDGHVWFCSVDKQILDQSEVSYEENCTDCGSDAIATSAWQYHLQQMVLSEKPLQYLAQFLKEANE